MKTCQMPIDAIVAITYKCNSKCQMCDIWQIKDYAEIDAKEYLKLPASLRDINISGGEPFLRNDLITVIKNMKIACPRANLIISSNGLATESIENKMREILKVEPDMGVAVSLDGAGPIHDKIRGIEGAYKRVLETMSVFKTLKVKDIKIAFTLTNDNLAEMRKVYDLSQELKVDFTLAAMQSSDIYFGSKENILNYDPKLLKDNFNYIIKRQLKTWKIKQWARAYFTWGLCQFILGRGRILPAEAGGAHFFLDPKGIIYPSVIDNQVMGDITAVDDFQEIWCSEENKKLRQELKAGLAKPSWMICTARAAMKKYLGQVGWWVLKNKFF